MKPGPTRFQVLLVEEEDRGWTAQCLQYDISVSAPTLEDVLYAFERAVFGHQAVARSQGIEPFKNMPPAPERCRHLWNEAYTLQLEIRSAFSLEDGSPIPAPPRELRYRRDRPSEANPQPC